MHAGHMGLPCRIDKRTPSQPWASSLQQASFQPWASSLRQASSLPFPSSQQQASSLPSPSSQQQASVKPPNAIVSPTAWLKYNSIQPVNTSRYNAAAHHDEHKHLYHTQRQLHDLHLLSWCLLLSCRLLRAHANSTQLLKVLGRQSQAGDVVQLQRQATQL